MQLPTHQTSGFYRGVLVINPSTSSSNAVASLPTEYTSVLLAALETKQFTAPTIGCTVIPRSLDTLKQVTKREYEWLESVESAQES